jgi:hypothetical protein
VSETGARLPAPARSSPEGAKAAPGSRELGLRRLLRWPGLTQCAAAAFLIGHLFIVIPGTEWGTNANGSIGFLNGDLDDIDAVNFAMGVQRFDVAEHRPHPPGYPLFTLLGKLGYVTVGQRAGWHSPTAVYAWSLAFWGALAGALAAFPLYRLSRLIVDDPRVAAGATILTLTCPLYWFTASRPLSDMPGLAAVLAVQAILAAAFVRQQGWRERAVAAEELMSTGRLIVIGALLAGFIIGLRSQSFWLTLPLLALVIADRAGRGAAGAIVGSAFTFTFGVLLWFVPLIVVSGGPARYWTALTSQAGEDIEGVDMLLTSTQPVRRLAFNLYETFVLPWGALPLAVLVLVLATVGALVMLRTSRRGLVLLAGLVVPYAAFHLLYQENATTRYALPLVPVVALLCARGIQSLTRNLAGVCAALIAAGGLWVAAPAVARAATPYTPAFTLFHTIAGQNGRRIDRPESLRARADDPVVAMHRRVFTETRRTREWMGADLFPWTLLPSPRGHEWLELVKFWREGQTKRVYFVADPRRTDLALIDPASRRLMGHYGWPFAYPATFVGGARPGEMDWWVIDGPPGWLLGEGWALTPETAGVAGQDGKGPAQGGAVGWIRRRAGPVRLMIGGRNLGAANAPPVRFTASLDGRAIETWEVKPNPGFFLRTFEAPAGSLVDAPAGSGGGASPFAELRVTAAPADGSTSPTAASVEQFNLQAPDAVMFGYDEGWHEDEYNPRTGLRWRWASDRAVLRVWGGGQDVRVRISVESPLQTFDEAPIVTLGAGDRPLATLTPRQGFTMDVRVPADVLVAAGGRLTLSTTKVFVPAERVGAGDPRRNDRRRLGLRVWSASVTPTSVIR